MFSCTGDTVFGEKVARKVALVAGQQHRRRAVCARRGVDPVGWVAPRDIRCMLAVDGRIDTGCDEVTAHCSGDRLRKFDATHLADAVTNIPTIESVGHCRVGFDSPSMLEAMQTFKVMSAIAAGAREKVYG